MDFPPDCMKPSGPIPAKLMVIGEAPGETEEALGTPFVGNAGNELRQLFLEAGIDWHSCRFTNVLLKRPPGNKLDAWCVPKAETGTGYSYEPLSVGKYLHPGLLDCIPRLREEIAATKPNLVLSLGGLAAWAITGVGTIGRTRGAVALASIVPRLKVLTTYHPSFLFKMWENRPIVLADIIKSKREAEYPELRLPVRTVYLIESSDDAAYALSRLLLADELSVDIETRRGFITDIGFSPSADEAYVFSFFDERKPEGAFWPSHALERMAWNTVGAALASPIQKTFQNGLYDLQYILRMGLRIRAVKNDTMIKHHALYPEMKKDLGFLGSIYTNEASWKLMRQRRKEVEKKDE